jgi:hypothetical protein
MKIAIASGEAHLLHWDCECTSLWIGWQNSARGSDAFADNRDALTATDARRRETVATVPPSQLKQHRQHQARAGCR